MAIFPANATLIFERANTPQSINAYGTPTVSTEPYIVVASLRESRMSQSQQLNDADYFQIPMVGRAITPKAMPNDIKPGTDSKIYLWRLTTAFKLPESFADLATLNTFAEDNEANIIQRGVFHLKADTSSRFKVQQILGDKIEGTLTTQVAWDEIA